VPMLSIPGKKIDSVLMELLKASIPVTIVQDIFDILGHSSLTTIAIYLRISAQETNALI